MPEEKKTRKPRKPREEAAVPPPPTAPPQEPDPGSEEQDLSASQELQARAIELVNLYGERTEALIEWLALVADKDEPVRVDTDTAILIVELIDSTVEEMEDDTAEPRIHVGMGGEHPAVFIMSNEPDALSWPGLVRDVAPPVDGDDEEEAQAILQPPVVTRLHAVPTDGRPNKAGVVYNAETDKCYYLNPSWMRGVCRAYGNKPCPFLGGNQLSCVKFKTREEGLSEMRHLPGSLRRR
jgi:hypothetical protein